MPELAWSFHIGGYQPAQKWLKDRKGRKLTSTMFALPEDRQNPRETHRIMQESVLPLD